MKKFFGPIATVIITAAAIWFYYSFEIINSEHLSQGGGDGFKNYFTIAYYLKNNTGVHFTGMNYPYGENIVFTDNQPVVSWILKGVSKFAPSISDHVYSYIYWSFFLSIIISSLFLYKILTEFKIPPVFATLFAIFIALLAPQMTRLVGHFALDYSCFLPILLYLVIKYFKTNGSIRYLLPLLLTITFFSFIHIYYFGMGCMFIGLTIVSYSFVNRANLTSHLKFIGGLALCIAVPAICLKSYLILTDPTNDRPSIPWGFVDSRSTVADIFLHVASFTGQAISQIFPHARIAYHSEGRAYIGLVPIIALACGLVIYIKARVQKKESRLLAYPLNLFIIPAVIILLYAMAFPFSITPFEKYYDFLPAFIKQFRASGRFSWVFYYISTITAVVIIYQLFVTLLQKRPFAAYSFIITCCLVWCIEVNMLSNWYKHVYTDYSTMLYQDREAKAVDEKLLAAGKNPGDFQAIMALPFTLNGSEKLYIEDGPLFEAMKLSLFTGLPINSGSMSRTSLGQTLKIANLLSNDLVHKDVLRDYKSDKPLLLVLVNDNLNDAERSLANQAQPLFTIGAVRYLQLPLTAFKDSVQVIKERFKYSKNTLFNHGTYLSSDSDTNVIVNRFEEQPKPYAAFGGGANYCPDGMIYLYYDTLPKAKDSTTYELSIWLYSDKRISSYPILYITQIDSLGKEISKHDLLGKFSTNNYKNWVRIQADVFLTGKKNKLLVTAQGRYATYDEFMVRPKNVNVITGLVNDSTFIFNNFPIQ